MTFESQSDLELRNLFFDLKTETSCFLVRKLFPIGEIDFSKKKTPRAAGPGEFKICALTFSGSISYLKFLPLNKNDGLYWNTFKPALRALKT